MAVGRADHHVEPGADRVHRQTRRDVDHLLEVLRSARLGRGVEDDGELRTAHVDVFTDHQGPHAGGGRPVDEARVVAGDVLAHRHEPGQRVGGGAADHRFVLHRPHGALGAEQVVHLRVDDDRGHLPRTAGTHREPECVDPFDVDRSDVEQAASTCRDRAVERMGRVRGDRIGVDPDLLVVAAVDDRGTARAEPCGIAQAVRRRGSGRRGRRAPRGSGG